MTKEIKKLEEKRGEKVNTAKKNLEEIKVTIEPYTSKEKKNKFVHTDSSEKWVETRHISR